MANPVQALRSRAAEVLRPNAAPDTRAVYLAMAELVRRVAEEPTERAAASDLTPFELRVFSQNGEDGVIAEIVRRVQAPSRYFVEFGIETGHEGNSVFLADVLGWSGLFIEADDAAFEGLERKYAANDRVTTLKAAVTPENVESLFEGAGVPAEPDLLSIDIDGDDYWVWAAIERFRPRIVIVEYNGALDPRRPLVQRRATSASRYDGSDVFGASLAALRWLGAEKGYRLVHSDLCGVNAFFVRDDLAAALPDGDGVPMRRCNFWLAGGRPAESAEKDSLFIDPTAGGSGV